MPAATRSCAAGSVGWPGRPVACRAAAGRAAGWCRVVHPARLAVAGDSKIPYGTTCQGGEAAVAPDRSLLTEPAERTVALRTITEHLTPGQWSYARQPTAKELAATSVLELPLTEASVKIRTGGPSDEPEDYAMDVWAGVVPVTTAFGDPEPDAALRDGIGALPHILGRELSSLDKHHCPFGRRFWLARHLRRGHTL